MKNVIYKGLAIPASESEDGDTPTIYWVTREANGFMLSRESFEAGHECLEFNFYTSHTLTERAVNLTRAEKRDHEQSKAKATA